MMWAGPVGKSKTLFLVAGTPSLMKCSHFILQPSRNEGTIKLSSRYFRRHPLLRCRLRLSFSFPLHLRLLPRLVLLEKAIIDACVRVFLNVFCSCSMVRLAPLLGRFVPSQNIETSVGG